MTRACDVDPPLVIIVVHTKHRRHPVPMTASDDPPVQRFEPFVRARQRGTMVVVGRPDDVHGRDTVEIRATAGPISAARLNNCEIKTYE